MKYAKYIPSLQRREAWEQLVTRNMNMHIARFPELEKEIREAYSYVFSKKILTSMRSMQFAGKPIDVNPARMYNCSFLHVDDWRSFSEVMFLLLGGTGVGYSVQFHHIEQLPKIRKPVDKKRYLIGDSIEGWADAVRILVKAYMVNGPKPVFDFRDIRPKGARLVTSGGKAPGHIPLKECLTKIESVFESKKDGEKLTPFEAHLIMCHIAVAVLSGGIRRAAMISLFSFDDEEMLSCKSGDWYNTRPELQLANNSAVILRNRIEHEEFKSLWEKIRYSGAGEPGFFFTNDTEMGLNPCAEISLKNGQFCNLVTMNTEEIHSQEELEEFSRVASFLATLQAAYTDFHYLRPIWKKVTEKEALIGVSMTGIAAGTLTGLNLKKAAKVVQEENVRVAKLLGINPAARTTCIKPEGTTSLVLGTSSGIHARRAKYYLRRVRVGKNEAIYPYLHANYPELLEDDFFKPSTQAVITVPQKSPEGSLLIEDETSIKALERVKYFHENWIKPGHKRGANTNNVSATIYIAEDEWDVTEEWLWENRNAYTALSFLPVDNHTYKQAPFETTDEATFNELSAKLKLVDLSSIHEIDDETDLKGELACSGGACEI
jgi:ribonucleoside-triphosphate reductase